MDTLTRKSPEIEKDLVPKGGGVERTIHNSHGGEGPACHKAPLKVNKEKGGTE